ncbi:MAG: hypothetical protein M3493_11400 [Actinomycetota bacterium]|jgi:hypothetical protein|nr:hypothetical protein [Actinomycetota bacterium]
MESLWLAAPLIGCAAMMFVMMKMMSGMGGGDRSDAAPQQPDKEALNAQSAELERRLEGETASRERSR